MATPVANTLTLVLVFGLIVGTIAATSLWSVARAVTIHKHPDWTFNAAFGFVYTRGLIAFALSAAIIAVIWFFPWWPTDSNASIAIGLRINATFLVMAIDLLHYYRTILGKIRKPPA
jgi:hypothetical protein